VRVAREVSPRRAVRQDAAGANNGSRLHRGGDGGVPVLIYGPASELLPTGAVIPELALADRVCWGCRLEGGLENCVPCHRASARAILQELDDEALADRGVDWRVHRQVASEGPDRNVFAE